MSKLNYNDSVRVLGGRGVLMQLVDGLETVLAEANRLFSTFSLWMHENGRASEWLTAVGVPFAIAGGMVTFWANQRSARKQEAHQWSQEFIHWEQERQAEEERIKRRQKALAALMVHIRIRTAWASNELSRPTADALTVSRVFRRLSHYCRMFQSLNTDELDRSDVMAPWDDFTVVLIDVCHDLERETTRLSEQGLGDIRSDLDGISKYLSEIGNRLDEFFVMVANGVGLDDDWVSHHRDAMDRRDELAKIPELSDKIEEARLVALKGQHELPPEGRSALDLQPAAT